MDTTNLIKYSMIAGIGIFTSNTSVSGRNLAPVEVASHSIVSNTKYTSSTRFNNSQRFSLEQLKHNKRKLNAIKDLKTGWNGYDGDIIDPSIILKTEEIISKLDYQPQIFPTGRGSIQLEKHIDEKNFVEIEISTDEVFAFRVKNGEEIEKEISDSEINDFISELFT